MRLSTIAMALLLICAAYGQESETNAAYGKAYADWEKNAFGQAASSSVEQSFMALEGAWSAMSGREQEFKAYYYAQAARVTAGILIEANQHEKAAAALSEIGEVTNSYSITPSRGKSEKAFQNLATIHASVIAATGKDPLKGHSIGYELKRHENGFSAIQESLDINRGSPQGVPIAIEDLEESETTATLLLLDANGDLIEIVPVAVDRTEGRRGSLLDRITSAYKLTNDSGPRRPVRTSVAEFLGKVGKVDTDGSRPERNGVESRDPDSAKPSAAGGNLGQGPNAPATVKWIVLVLAVALLVIALAVLLSKRRWH
ncbi:hypothetical protein [Luteolibacter sp. Populi]|uniref:hypothetical protein n=1 Tax=Luteolibacter sp. Populi TaxID=3230487 RepID=UPI0034667CC2